VEECLEHGELDVGETLPSAAGGINSAGCNVLCAVDGVDRVDRRGGFCALKGGDGVHGGRAGGRGVE